MRQYDESIAMLEKAVEYAGKWKSPAKRLAQVKEEQQRRAARKSKKDAKPRTEPKSSVDKPSATKAVPKTE